MNTFICEHPEVVTWAYAILIAILGGACSLIIYFLKIKVSRLRSIENKLDTAIQNHDLCRETLPERFSSKDSVEKICSKIDDVREKISQFALIYRTKDESAREWKLMENRLTSMEGNIKQIGDSAAERHREIWDKINRVVDMFRDERTKIEMRLIGITDSKKNEDILEND